MTETIQEQQPSAFKPSPEFIARKKRMDDAMNLRKPDRVPVAPLTIHYYHTRLAGLSNKEAGYNTEKNAEALKQATIRHNWDSATEMSAVRPSLPMEILGIKQMKWPGGALPDNQPFQWVEGEYMLQAEYDEMLADPNGFAVRKLWPRISTTLAPVGGMAQLEPPPLLFLSNAYTLSEFLGEIVSAPPMVELLEKMLALAKAHQKIKATKIKYFMDIMNLGFPVSFGAITFPAFDWISDALRGLKGSSMDMFRAPDKLIAAIEMFIPLTIGTSVMMAKQTGINGVFIPMHRGADGFMSEKQFAQFYWPGLKRLFLGLIEAGLTPIPLFEGNYTSRLEYLKELPPGKVVGHFDKVNRKKAKKLIGDVMCFWGNVPASMMITGTPQQVKDDVKELIDIFGDNGGLIIDSTMGIPDESRPENVQALTDAVHEFGIY